MNELRVIYDELVNKYGTAKDTVHTFSDKGTDHTYINFYQDQFRPYKSKVKMLEIGIMTGGSLLLWSKYFDNYKLTGIDLSPSWSSKAEFQQRLENDPNIELNFNISSTNKEYAERFADDMFDIILDDGDHDPATQFDTFKTYFKKLKTTGTYYIEDVRGQAEFTQILENIRAWELEENIPLAINSYIGNVAVRQDDAIIIIKRL
jgi:hypothetical protein